MSNLCCIPARGGSKRVPRKNIKPFLGKPIISYSIEAALQSRLFDEVMVSTDDPEIAAIAEKYGASVPFTRSDANASDYATLADVLIEVLDEYQLESKSFKNICCVLPTAPLTSSKRLHEAWLHFHNGSFDSVCPVVAISHPIFRALEIDQNGHLKMIWPEYLKSRSQDFKPAYHDSGSFYWVKTKALQNEETLFCKYGSAVILPEVEVQDIDTDSDWRLAELKYNILYG
jgi:pseudaminic acid cytidylyltransferase